MSASRRRFGWRHMDHASWSRGEFGLCIVMCECAGCRSDARMMVSYCLMCTVWWQRRSDAHTAGGYTRLRRSLNAMAFQRRGDARRLDWGECGQKSGCDLGLTPYPRRGPGDRRRSRPWPCQGTRAAAPGSGGAPPGPRRLVAQPDGSPPLPKCE